MGLDMYAYVAARAGQQNEFYEGSTWDPELKQSVNPAIEQPREIAYWRKHPNLHGWMEQLWNKHNGGDQDSSKFNGIEVELTWDDLDRLEHIIKKRRLPDTSGFFFGNNADQHYYDQDLEFVQKAKAETFLGLKVFYNSSW
jgi:hypothetical protein